MIFGYLNNLQDELKHYPEVIQKGLKYLQQHPLTEMELGKYPIDGDKVFAIINSYETEPKAARRLEAHKKYIDIQCIAAGQEMIGCGPLKDGGSITEDKFTSDDVAFFDGVKAETELVLQPGMFAIYFPWDLHRPNCAAGAPQKVRKAIIKIAVSEL